MQISFGFEVPVYDSVVYVSIGQPMDVLEKQMASWIGDKEAKSTLKFLVATKPQGCATNTAQGVILYVRDELLTAESFATIAHEVFHAAEYIMERAGVKYHKTTSSEAYAHLISYITTAIYIRLLSNGLVKVPAADR